MANFVALKTARDHRAGWNVRAEGLAGHPPLTMYMSTETHVVSSRGADMLGIGTEGVRLIPVGDDYRFHVDLLRAAIEGDRAAGRLPFAVVASAGTVATGAVDTAAGDRRPLRRAGAVDARGRRLRRPCAARGRSSARRSWGSSGRTPSRSTRTSGCTRSPVGVWWCGVWRTSRSRSTPTPTASSKDQGTAQHGLDLGRHGPQSEQGLAALEAAGRLPQASALASAIPDP